MIEQPQQVQRNKLPILFEGGIVSDSVETKVPSGGVVSLFNLSLDKKSLIPRPGFVQKYDALPTSSGVLNEVYHLDRYINLSGTVKLIAVGKRTDTGALSFYYWSGTAWVNITGSVSQVAASTKNPFSCNFKGRWFFTCGVALVMWDGSGNCEVVTNSTSALSPRAKPVTVSANASRLLLGGINDSGGTFISYRVDWSDFLQYDVWNGGTAGGTSKYQDLLTESDPIRCISVLGDMVYVFKDRAIYRSGSVGAPRIFEFRSFSKSAGCVSPRTMAEYKDIKIFLGDFAVYFMDHNEPKDVGSKIIPRMLENVNISYVYRIFAILDKEHLLYHLFLPKAGTTNHTLIYTMDLAGGGWTEGEIANTDIKPTCGLSYSEYRWSTVQLIGSSDSKIYEFTYDATTDDGDAFDPYIETSYIDILEYSQGKADKGRLQKVFVDSPYGELSLEVTWGDSLNDMRTMTAYTLDMTDDRSRYFTVNEEGRYFKLKITMLDSVAVIHKIWCEFATSGRSEVV